MMWDLPENIAAILFAAYNDGCEPHRSALASLLFASASRPMRGWWISAQPAGPPARWLYFSSLQESFWQAIELVENDGGESGYHRLALNKGSPHLPPVI